MRPEPSLTVISLGGGVQSSVMTLMASRGAFDNIPDCAIFADTHWEPPTIYTHLEWLAGQLRFPLHVVDNGRSLREDVKALTNHSGSQNYVDIPVYLKGRDGEGDGIGRRQCTDNYKIRPIRKKIRDLLGLKPRQRVPSGVTVELWLGISTDEAIRMKTSRDRWITNRYPLIEAAMSRQDCIDWWAARYDRPLERSACVACPFQSRQRWVETKRRWPDLFAEAVQIDANLRDSNRGLALDKTPYLHMLRMPLAEAVSLDEAEMGAGRAERRLRQRVRGTLWRLRSPEERRRERHHPAGLPMTPTPSISVSGSWLRLRWLFHRRLT